MIIPNDRIGSKCLSVTFLVFAFCPALLVILSLFARTRHFSCEIALPLFILTIVSLAATLIRLYRSTLRSNYSDALAVARTHIVLHLVPFAALVFHRFTVRDGWSEVALLSAMLIFFASGRIAWRTLRKLIPTTKMYALFYRGNSTLLVLLPSIFLTNLLAPGLVTFGTIENVLVIYFAIHFVLVGMASLRINADLRAINISDLPKRGQQ